MLFDNHTCVCGDENPYRRCRCSSISEEPCSFCDWWEFHRECEPPPQEREEDYGDYEDDE